MRNPKALTEWLELDYFERPRRLRRWRRGLLYLALLISGASVAFAFLPANKPAFQAGPLSEAHALFQHDCQVCHVEPFSTARRVVPGLDAHNSMDQACQKCHAGPPHHDTVAREQGCAVCHREHRGQSLTRIDDVSCSNCHADLAANLKPGATTKIENVSAFAPGKHPEFALWRNPGADPGTVRFNHALHLHDDGVADAAGVKQVLACQNCHQTDQTGRFMKPVNYQQHCQQCHPLKVAVVGDWKTEAEKKAAADFTKLPAPHDKPLIVRGTLRSRYLDFARQNPEVIGQAAAPLGRPLPGPRPPQSQAGSSDQFAWVDSQVDKAERILFQGGGGCQYCHQVASWQKDGLPVIAAPNMRTPWFESARFGHDAHRLLDCQQCHAARQSSQTVDVLLPDVNSCMQCHRQGAARNDCGLCHTYHDRKRERAFRGTLTIQDCTRGATWPR